MKREGEAVKAEDQEVKMGREGKRRQSKGREGKGSEKKMGR